MKYFNVHRTDGNKLQGLLNAHTLRGWDVHHIRGLGNDSKGHLMVVFVREFDSERGLDSYLESRAARKANEKPKAIETAEPIPA